MHLHAQLEVSSEYAGMSRESLVRLRKEHADARVTSAGRWADQIGLESNSRGPDPDDVNNSAGERVRPDLGGVQLVTLV
ncbi:hypothetical protein CsSME_00008776 [Camellia sinensis var. sinensis]